MNQEVSDATLKSFCDGYQDFLSFPIFMAKFSKMDHVQNIDKLCQYLDILSGSSLDNRIYNASEKKNQGFNFDLRYRVIIWIHSI